MKQWAMTFKPRLSVLADVGQTVRDSLRLTDAAYDVAVAVLLVEEVVTHVVVHATTNVVLTLSEVQGRLHVEVQDEARTHVPSRSLRCRET